MRLQDSALIRVGLAALLVCSLITHGKVCLGQTTLSETKPEKLDEYSDLPTDDEAAHLDFFAEKLFRQPGLRGQIVARSLLVKKYGIDASRVAIKSARSRNDGTAVAEMWVVPAGAKFPTTTSNRASDDGAIACSSRDSFSFS